MGLILIHILTYKEMETLFFVLIFSRAQNPPRKRRKEYCSGAKRIYLRKEERRKEYCRGTRLSIKECRLNHF